MVRNSDSSTITAPAPARSAVFFDLARPEDDAAICRLLRNSPMEGRVRLALQRDPSALAAGTIEGDRHDLVVARNRADGRVVGVGSRAVRSVYINGQLARLGYLGQLRRDPACLGRKRLLVDGFALCRALRAADELPYDLTSIVSDNRLAQAILTGGLANLPTYTPVESLVTLMLPLRHRASGAAGTEITHARREDLDAVARCLQSDLPRYQFAPHWTADDLSSPERCRGLQPGDFHLARSGNQITGCLAVWDQRSFKQVVVHGYHAHLARWRWLVNLAATSLGRPTLPPPGGQLNLAYLSHLAIEDDDPHIFRSLLCSACCSARERGLSYLVLGLASRHPLLSVVRRYFPCHAYCSTLYLVHDDSAAAAIRALDGRVAHVEVATL